MPTYSKWAEARRPFKTICTPRTVNDTFLPEISSLNPLVATRRRPFNFKFSSVDPAVLSPLFTAQGGLVIVCGLVSAASYSPRRIFRVSISENVWAKLYVNDMIATFSACGFVRRLLPSSVDLLA